MLSPVIREERLHKKNPRNKRDMTKRLNQIILNLFEKWREMHNLCHIRVSIPGARPANGVHRCSRCSAAAKYDENMLFHKWKKALFEAANKRREADKYAAFHVTKFIDSSW